MNVKTNAEMKAKFGITDEQIAAGRVELNERERSYRLKEIRKQFGLNQTALAKMIGVNQRRISAIENSNLSSIEVNSLARYANALGGRLTVSIDTDDGQHFDLSETINQDRELTSH